MQTALMIMSITAFAGAAVMFWRARTTYAAMEDHNGVAALARRVTSLERDRDTTRRQLDESGEHQWPFEVPDNVHPRVVDYRQEEATT